MRLALLAVLPGCLLGGGPVLAPMLMWGERGCGSDEKVFTLTLGVRTVAGMTELYVVPKANIYEGVCLD